MQLALNSCVRRPLSSICKVLIYTSRLLLWSWFLFLSFFFFSSFFSFFPSSYVDATAIGKTFELLLNPIWTLITLAKRTTLVQTYESSLTRRAFQLRSLKTSSRSSIIKKVRRDSPNTPKRCCGTIPL